MAKNSRDLTKGSVLKNLFLFALPILCTNLLQQLYHAADIMVVGNFAQNSKIALAAVGSTGSVTNLLLNLFIGLSLGVNVVCANAYGSRDRDKLGKAMETGLLVAVFSGIIVSLLGYFLARPMLEMVGSPDTVIDQATIYMKIVFLGQPGSLIYNFGSGILRAHGDTKRPMYILTASGLVNVVLNLFFVIVFHMDAAGVALATTVSHYVSAAAILFLLAHPSGEQGLRLFHLNFDWNAFKSIVKIGVPGGINGIVFSVSNVVIVTGLNSLGDVVIAGNSAAASVDAFTYQIMVAFYTACISFAGQNYGAKNFKRIDQLLKNCILLTMGIYLLVFGIIAAFPEFFIGIFTKDPQIIKAGIPRLYTIGTGYFLYIISEMSIGCLRGMGKSVVPTVLNAVSICLPRILWVNFVFPMNPSLFFLYLCYPISYVFSDITQLGCYLYYSKKDKKAYLEQQKEQIA